MANVEINTPEVRELARSVRDAAGQADELRRSVLAAMSMADVADGTTTTALGDVQDRLVKLGVGLEGKADQAEMTVFAAQPITLAAATTTTLATTTAAGGTGLQLPTTPEDGQRFIEEIRARLAEDPFEPIRFTDQNVSVIIMPSPQGFPVLREDGGTLTGAAGQRDTPNGFEVVVDAQFTDIPNIVDAISTKLGNLVGGSIAVLDYLPDGNVSLSRLEAEGLIIENGKTLNGRSSPETFHLSLNDGVWDMAKGDPAATSGLGIGGGIPLLMDGLPFGKVNVYRDGAPAGLPETGDPGTGNTQYLLQRSSAGFGDYDDRGTAVGKVVTALGPDGTVIVMVQEDGTDGPKVSELRDALKQMGATDAVAFDGSASATLVVDGKVEIAPSKFRDNMMTAGLGLRLPLSEAGLTNFVNGNEMYAGTQLAFPDSPAAPPGDYLDDWFTPVPTDVPDDIFNAPEILDWSDLSMGFPGGGDSFAYYGGSPADSFPMPESWDFSSPELQFDNSYDFPGGLDFGNYDFSEYDAFSGLDSMSFGGFEDYTWE